MPRSLPGGVLMALLLVPRIGFGVTVATTLENTSAPLDDPGWSNVGVLRGATAVYLGERWVLTAAHVGMGTVTFPGLGGFTAESGSQIQLANPSGSGLTKPADLLLFRLADDPGLPPLQIGESSPSVGDEVVVIGNGLNRSTEAVYWDVNQRSTGWIWTESAAPADYEGFHTQSPQTMRWGTNLIEEDETFGNEFDDDILAKLRQASTDTLTLLTEFDQDGGRSDASVQTASGSSATPFESQAVLSDSGGGMFIKRGGQWELIGTTLAVDGHRDQPDVTRNPLYGNVTYYADLASYRPQIESHWLYGDFDGNLQLDVADIDLLSAALSGPYDAHFDLDRDGKLDRLDHARWVEQVFGTWFGDANLDGEFSTTDLVYVLQGGQYEDAIVGNSSWATGDWNGDLEFSTQDFVVALQAGGFEQGPWTGEAGVDESLVASVPEPCSAFGLLAIGLLALASLRCRPSTP